MSGIIRDTSAPGSWPEHSRAATSPVPVESRTVAPSASDQHIPHELLISLTSTVCNGSTTGPGSHHQHCKGCGVRRPDAVWHHPFGRNKYKYFLEQPTSVTGAGRDISFLCDATITQRRTAPLPPLTDRGHSGEIQDLTVSQSLIPEDYHIVTNKGLRSLEFYEDAFTVQLHDDEHNLRTFPSLRPSGRLEAVQLMRTMDSMLQEAGVDQQCEELTELSQMEGLLELVRVEQNIYNIVFHELIRQVSVGCAERGQLLAKLRHRYQSLLERIPCRLKALHTEVVAQRALDRQLTEEIHRVKASIQQLSTEMSKITDHDAFVFHQAERAHQQLAETLAQTLTSSDVLQGYHDLYELQRGRLEAQLLQATEERDCWSRVTLCLALKVISVKKLKLVSQLHICEQSWFRTAEHCVLYLSNKDTHDLNVIMKLMDNWKEQLTAFTSQLKKSEHTQCEQISAVKQGIVKWLVFCTAENKCDDPKYEKTTLETMHEDLKQWLHILAVQCERYEGENVLSCQQTLGELTSVQEKWLIMSDQLLRRHLAPDGQLPGGHQVLSELERMLPELFRELGAQVSGENGIHKHIMSLYSLIESWVPKLGAVIGRRETASAPDWLKLEKALSTCQSLAEEAFNISSLQTDKDTVKMLDKVQEFRTNLFSFTNGENQRLSEQVSFIHMAQTRWMLDLLILMVPDHGEDQNQNQEHFCTKSVSIATLDENAKMLAEKLDYCSKYISSSYQLILDEQISQNLHQDENENENEKNECTKLQMESREWVETCTILLSGVKGGHGELPVRQPVTVPRRNIPVDPATNMETQEKVEPLVCENTVVKLIGYDGNITERILGERNVHLCGTHELVVTPATDEAQEAFSDLTTVRRLQEELYDSELRVQTAEQRALKAEEALQAALQRIQDLERELQGRPSLEPQSVGKTTETPAPLSPPVPLPGPQPAPPKTAPVTTGPTTGTRKFKKH